MPLIKPLFNPLKFSYFILLQILSFALIFILLFFLSRLIMVLNFLPKPLINANFHDTILTFLLGAVSDLRLISAAFLPLLVAFILGFLMDYFANNWGGGQTKLLRFYLFISSIFIALLAFVFILFCFVNFYYYQMYQTNIDTFIFALKDDETTAVLGIIFNDYPVIFLAFTALCFTIFCVGWNLKLSKLRTTIHLRFRIALLFVFIFLLFYTLALRGPFRHITMNVENYKFSKIESFNRLVLNPLMSFAFAHKMYKEESLDIARADEKEGEVLQENLFPLFETSPKNPIAKLQKPHIMVNLMESFGGQMLMFNHNNFNLLGALKEHFESDFVFERFLPFANGTAPSLSFLFLNSPKTLSKSQYKKHYLPLSPIEIYKKQGYKVLFLTSGNRAWFGMGDFMRAQGIDALIDEIIMSEEYAEANKTRNSYGILDEFIYQKAFELLNNAKEPLLILALSTSNHPPFPNVYESIAKDKIPNEILQRFPKNAYTILNAYIYANNEFGKFLRNIKESALKDRVIIAATGDHRVRDMQSDFSTEQALSYAVPFYLYVPKTYQHHLYYDKNRVGSHKDIFPTLYALSLDEVEYLNMGGRNLLGEIKNPKYEFGYNEAVWIDAEGIYSTNLGFHYKNPQSLLNAESFTPSKEILNFKNLYEQWLSYTLALRLVNLQEN